VSLSTGTPLGPYEIVALLGAGGMGEVYTARDTRLARTVALKTLTSQRSDVDARERFKREARAIASLNHPNICQLYDVGTEGAVDYLVLEYLEGETLADRLRTGPLPADQLVRCALDVAEALDAAHRRGVVHRDLKPANIFLTATGITKVLDFGLAKLVDNDVSDAATAAKTRMLTGVGTALGTVAYMSPEQARGEELDERTDIFSFGAVLYEMATGAPAFSGKTSAIIFKALLDETPVAASTRNRIIPKRLGEIIAKALEKDRAFRYQSGAELRADLQRLKRDSESSASSAVRPAPGRARVRVGLIAGLTVVVLGAVAGGIYYVSRRSPAARAPWEQLTFFTDAAVYPALSPDGRMLAFIRGGDPLLPRGELYVKLLPSGNAVQLTNDGIEKLEPVFSPDGSRITYGTAVPFDQWEVPVLGGAPTLRWKNASSLSWIDSGRRLLFSEIRDGLRMVLITTNEARGETRDVYVPPGNRMMVHHSYLSPDSRSVLMVVMNQRGDLGPCQLVPFEGGGPVRVVGPPDSTCVSASWSRDGKWIYTSSDAGRGAFHIWRQRFPDGPLEQVTSGATEETGIAMSTDGASLLTSVGVRDSTIWLHDAGGDHQLSSEGRTFDTRFSSDATTLYYLVSTGADSSLWARNLKDGTSGLVVTASAIQPGSVISRYAISLDGKTAALAIDEATMGAHIWLVPLDRRSSPRRIESPNNEDSPLFLPNGDLVVRGTEGGRNYAYRISLTTDGGRRKLTPDAIISGFAVSPDGRWVVLGNPIGAAGPDDPGGPRIYPMDGGPGIRLCNFICIATWDLTGQFLHIAVPTDSATYVLPVNASGIPDVPSEGYTRASLRQDNRATRLDALVESASGTSVYSYTKETTRRNIYRIPLPE
jgi:Tol biopolymer transport system component